MTVNVRQDIIENTLSQENVKENITQLNSVTQNPKQGSENKIEDQVQEDPNWKAFREARKKDREERQIAEKKASDKEAEVAALKAAMEAAFSKSAPTPQAYQQYYGIEQQQHEETEDERIEKKVQAVLALRESQYEKKRLEKEHQEYPNRLIQTYSDFHQTIAQENLDYLDFHYPEVSRPLQRLPDGFDRWSDIYKAVKKFVPNNTSSKKDASRADSNFNKPKSISSNSITQPGEVTGSARLTEDKRASNWERMQKILKGVS